MGQSSLRVAARLACAFLIFCVMGCSGSQLRNSFQTPTSTLPATSASGSFASISLSLLPASATVIAGQQVQFASPFLENVTWKVNGITGGDSVHGTVSASGNYAAPLLAPAEGITVTAQLGTFGSSPSASAEVTG